MQRNAYHVLIDGRRHVIYGPTFERAVEMFQQSRQQNRLQRATTIVPVSASESHEQGH